MQFYYGEKNILRVLDEAEFWKHQEAEHTTVILLVTSGLEREFVEKLKEYEREFNSIHAKLVKATESVVRSKGMISNSLKIDFINLIRISLRQSNEWVDFLEKTLQQSAAVQKNIPSQAVINHIIRESQYFIGIDQLIL